jgi:hypothetical protein
MTSTPKIAVGAASEAAFGSSARGDIDRLSDRDFLIVDDDPKILRARANTLKAEGVSVAAYTFRKLQSLAGTGALFVQHLRLEASIVTDRDGRLAALLGAFRPKERYDVEIRNNASLAGLIATVPPGANAELWAADVLYVTVRNFGILWLAGRQQYLFAYDRILEALQEEGVLDAPGVSNLRRLRFLKSLYRGDSSATPGIVDRKVRAALAGLPRGHFPACSLTVSASEALTAPAPADGSPAYLQLRDLEKRLLAACSLVSGPFDDPALTALNKWIRDPRAYANLSAARAPVLRAKLAALDKRLSAVRLG